MRPGGGPILYRLVKMVLGPALRAAFDVDIQQGAKIPDAGPVIVAANHRSFMDSVFLAAVVPRPISFLAKAEYFDSRVGGWLFRSLGQTPVVRGSPAGARRAMRAAEDVLRRGQVVGVYPEGTRSRDGVLHRGQLGPVRLAAASGASILPVGLVGTHAVQAPSESIPHLGRPVSVRFGEALRVDERALGDRTELLDLTDQLMRRIADLSGQTYAGATG